MGDKAPPKMKRSKGRRTKTRMADMNMAPGAQPGGPGGKCPKCGRKHAGKCK